MFLGNYVPYLLIMKNKFWNEGYDRGNTFTAVGSFLTPFPATAYNVFLYRNFIFVYFCYITDVLLVFWVINIK